MARGAARLVGLAREIGTIGNRNAHSDASVAEALARAALAGAVENVRVNVQSLSEPGLGRSLHVRSEEHTSELQSQSNLVCRLLLEKKKPNRKSAAPEPPPTPAPPAVAAGRHRVPPH